MEFDLIDLIHERMTVRRPDVLAGSGDDAALLAPPPGQTLAVSVDTLVEGVHFLPGSDPLDLGWKALAVNLSDLAAMGAQPAWAVLALTLPRDDRTFVEGFATGFAQLAAQHELALVGGDTTQGPLTISVTVHGLVPRGQALLRSGAQAGDGLFVTGPLGDAAAALHCLDDPATAARTLRTRLERPEPRVAAGLALRGLAHAAIDISDGLLADLAHICRASGVGAQVAVAALPLSEALVAQFGLARARDFALAGGDVYELCFSAPLACEAQLRARLDDVGCALSRIGEITAEAGLQVLDEDGGDVTPAIRGWEHFRHA